MYIYKNDMQYNMGYIKFCSDILVNNLYIYTSIYILRNNLRSVKYVIKKIPFIFVTKYIYMFVKRYLYFQTDIQSLHM